MGFVKVFLLFFILSNAINIDDDELVDTSDFIGADSILRPPSDKEANINEIRERVKRERRERRDVDMEERRQNNDGGIGIFQSMKSEKSEEKHGEINEEKKEKVIARREESEEVILIHTLKTMSGWTRENINGKGEDDEEGDTSPSYNP